MILIRLKYYLFSFLIASVYNLNAQQTNVKSENNSSQLVITIEADDASQQTTTNVINKEIYNDNNTFPVQQQVSASLSNQPNELITENNAPLLTSESYSSEDILSRASYSSQKSTSIKVKHSSTSISQRSFSIRKELKSMAPQRKKRYNLSRCSSF